MLTEKRDCWPTGTHPLRHCDEAIEKGTMRVAVEREVDTGTFTSTGPGYLHPGCAAEYTGDESLLEKIKANVSLPEEDMAALGAEL